MNKCYLLLRNNKETGPYTLTDLVQLSLTSNDLIWVEGKSAGWRYPFELDELKEAMINRSEPLQPAANSNSSSAVEPLQVERPSATKIFVSLPSGVKQQAMPTTPSLEEKAEAVRQKALSFSKEKEVSEVNYTRSLTDIKEEYAGWIQEQKEKRNRFTVSKPLALTVILVIITGACFLLLQWKPQQGKPAKAMVVSSKEVTPITNSNLEDIVNNKPIGNTLDEVAQKNKKQKPTKNNSANADVATPRKKQALLFPQEVKQTLPPSLPAAAPVKRKVTVEIPITELLQTTSHYTKNKEGIGLSIELHNKSDKNIRVAAIDVIYFDKAKAQIAKETLYFSNVQPGALSTKNSSPKKAASASYRIGLVSAENAGLYVVQL